MCLLSLMRGNRVHRMGSYCRVQEEFLFHAFSWILHVTLIVRQVICNHSYGILTTAARASSVPQSRSISGPTSLRITVKAHSSSEPLLLRATVCYNYDAQISLCKVCLGLPEFRLNDTAPLIYCSLEPRLLRITDECHKYSDRLFLTITVPQNHFSMPRVL